MIQQATWGLANLHAFSNPENLLKSFYSRMGFRFRPSRMRTVCTADGAQLVHSQTPGASYTLDSDPLEWTIVDSLHRNHLFSPVKCVGRMDVAHYQPSLDVAEPLVES